MAKLGVEVTGMSAPDTRGASRIFEGIVDRSAGMNIAATTGLIKGVGDMAIDAYHGKALSDAQKEDERVVTEAESRLLADHIFNSPLEEDQVDPVLKAYGMSTQKYANALKQGVMSPEEFESRTLANLRKAVNKNPGLSDELTAYTKKQLELTGMSSTLKQEALMQKTQAEQENMYRNKLIDKGFEFGQVFDPSTPIYEMQATLRPLMEQKAKWDFVKNYKEAYTDEQAESWFEANGTDTYLGSLHEWNQTTKQLIAEAVSDPSKFSNIKTEFMLSIPKQKKLFLETLPYTLRNKPQGIQMIKDYNEALDLSGEIMDSAGSGEDASKAIEASLKGARAFQELEVREIINPEMSDRFFDYLQKASGVMQTNPKITEEVNKFLLLTLSKDPTKPKVINSLPKDYKEPLWPAILSSVMQYTQDTGDNTLLIKHLEGNNEIVKATTNEQTKFNFLRQNLEAIGKADFENPDVAVFSNTKEMVTNFLADPKFGLRQMFANMENSPNTTLEVLEDGRFNFIGENASAFNSTFGIVLNTSLTAYARSQNLTTKQATERFQRDYMRDYMPVEGETKTPSLKSEVPVEPVLSFKERETLRKQEGTKDYNKALDESVLNKIYPFLRETTRKQITMADHILFDSWRELVSEGMLTSANYLAKVRDRMTGQDLRDKKKVSP